MESPFGNPLFILALVAAFIYTLVASIRNSSRIKSLEREVHSLKRLMAAGVTSAAAVQTESTESTVKPDFEAEEPSTPPAEDTALQAEYASEPEDAAAMAASEELAREEAQPAPAAEAVSTPATKESFESLLGARWAVWAGGLALALGGIFLVKYSIESGLLSPAVRLSLAAIFGLVLGLAGEAIRRKAVPGIATTYSNAMIPGVLTAAGALTLFGVVYAAYGIYDYIGPGAAFGLLGLVAFATIGLSLLHGQALAGLGLLGSMLTPALISTETPNIWALFVFLTVSWLATAAAARRQGWTVVPLSPMPGLASGRSAISAFPKRSAPNHQHLPCSSCWREQYSSGPARHSTRRPPKLPKPQRPSDAPSAPCGFCYARHSPSISPSRWP